MENNTSKLGLIKKALHVWAVQYHFVIPKDILKRYINKFNHERENISKYGQRFYNSSDTEQYNKWLTFQTYKTNTNNFTDITFVGKETNTNGLALLCKEKVDISKIHTNYVCLVGEGIHLYDEFFEYLNELDDSDVIYFDNDVYEDGNRSHPILKPDLSYNTLRGFNYIGNLVVLKKEVLKQFDGQDIDIYKFLLELSDQDLKWKHIEKILYGVKSNDFDVYPLNQYFKEHNIKVNLDMHSNYAYVKYPIVGNPLVSIMIPTKDGKDDLERCINSIYNKSTYTNFEIVIIDNNSEKEETFTYFEQLKKEHSNITIKRLEIPFNFSILNNEAVNISKGEYVLLLNNDTEVITEDWLEKMLSYAQLEKTGTVGAKLYYEDGTIQHGAVISGKGGGFAHRYYRKPHDEKGYLHTLDIPNDVCANTAACMMVSKTKWLEVDGMNEELAVQFNDVDFNIKLLEKGYYNVFIPDVELYHYESKSRGIDKDKEAVNRFFEEVNYAQEHYGKYLEHDPFYNDNFDKNYDYMLKVGTGSN